MALGLHIGHDEARSMRTMAWFKRSEKLDALYTTKVKGAGTGGKMDNFMVVIAPNRFPQWCLLCKIHRQYLSRCLQQNRAHRGLREAEGLH